MLASKLLVSKVFQRTLCRSKSRLTPKDVMKLGTLSHVAIATPNLDNTVKFYRDVLGARVGHTSEFPIHGVKAAYVELGNTQLEIMEPIGDTSPVARFMKRNPSGGLHHVCLKVSCVKVAAQLAKEAGLRLLEDRPPFGPHGQPVIFLHPSDCGGVLFELEEDENLQTVHSTSTVVSKIS